MAGFTINDDLIASASCQSFSDSPFRIKFIPALIERYEFEVGAKPNSPTIGLRCETR